VPARLPREVMRLVARLQVPLPELQPGDFLRSS